MIFIPHRRWYIFTINWKTKSPTNQERCFGNRCVINRRSTESLINVPSFYWMLRLAILIDTWSDSRDGTSNYICFANRKVNNPRNIVRASQFHLSKPFHEDVMMMMMMSYDDVWLRWVIFLRVREGVDRWWLIPPTYAALIINDNQRSNRHITSPSINSIPHDELLIP